MPSPSTIARLDSLVWGLIFGGLFVLSLGMATLDEVPAVGWGLGILGSIAAAAGVILIFVRARLTADSADSAQSNPQKNPERKS